MQLINKNKLFPNLGFFLKNIFKHFFKHFTNFSLNILKKLIFIKTIVYSKYLTND